MPRSLKNLRSTPSSTSSSGGSISATGRALSRERRSGRAAGQLTGAERAVSSRPPPSWPAMLIRWNRASGSQPWSTSSTRAGRPTAASGCRSARSRITALARVGPDVGQVALARPLRAEQGQAAAMPGRPGVHGGERLGVAGADDEIRTREGDFTPELQAKLSRHAADPGDSITARSLAPRIRWVDAWATGGWGRRVLGCGRARTTARCEWAQGVARLHLGLYRGTS